MASNVETQTSFSASAVDFLTKKLNVYMMIAPMVSNMASSKIRLQRRDVNEWHEFLEMCNGTW